MSLPKRKKNILEKICDYSNLNKAWKELNKSNKYSRGISEVTINTFASQFPQRKKKIHEDLLAKCFEFDDLRGTIIRERKSSGTKNRPIKIPEIKDRLVQKAISLKINMFLQRKYKLSNRASFAYRKNLGIRDALREMLLYFEKGNSICFESDIINFFDTVDKSKLLKMILDALPDSSADFLIESSLDQKVGNVFEFAKEDQTLFSETGIPQGGVLSPLFANVYLSGFDSEMLKLKYNLIRYADDFIVMCKFEKDAIDAYDISRKVIEEQLGLELHPYGNKDSKTRIIKISQDSLSFLGTTFTGKKLIPHKDKIKKLIFNLNEITEYKPDKSLLDVLERLNGYLEGWISAFCHTDLNTFFPKIYTKLYKRLGVFGYKIEWLNSRQPINHTQYIYAGLPDLELLLEKQRTNMMRNNIENKIFKKYWT